MLSLDIRAGDELVGTLSHEAETNQFSFAYAANWLESPGRFPLSPQLPLAAPNQEAPEQHSAIVRQFFENLLPEGEALDHAAQAAGTAKSNLPALLISLGKETAGALRVTVTGSQTVADGTAADSLRLVTPEQLSMRIRTRADQPFSVWDGKVRLSIAGYQDKIAVYEKQGKWYLVDGQRLASTVIVKPVPVSARLSTLPANEYMCMQLAQSAGIAAASTQLVHVPEPVLLVRRFDRVEHVGGVRRLHIVDGCQALGVAVAMKYERAYGDSRDVAHLRDGVSLPRLFRLLDQGVQPVIDRLALLRWVVFQVLIGNTDAHGKNVSFYCGAEGLRLAPAYDMVCIAALDAGLQSSYAMAIGDAFTNEQLTAYEWAHFAYQCGLPFALVAREMASVSRRVLEVMQEVGQDVSGSGVPVPVADRICEEITAACSAQMALAPKVNTFKAADFD